MFMGGVRPVAGHTYAFVVCEKSPMSWHAGTDRGTDHITTVFGGGFAGLADDIQTGVGPPPPCRPSV
jgi:hypothetical protein